MCESRLEETPGVCGSSERVAVISSDGLHTVAEDTSGPGLLPISGTDSTSTHAKPSVPTRHALLMEQVEKGRGRVQKPTKQSVPIDDINPLLIPLLCACKLEAIDSASVLELDGLLADAWSIICDKALGSQTGHRPEGDHIADRLHKFSTSALNALRQLKVASAQLKESFATLNPGAGKVAAKSTSEPLVAAPPTTKKPTQQRPKNSRHSAQTSKPGNSTPSPGKERTSPGKERTSPGKGRPSPGKERPPGAGRAEGQNGVLLRDKQEAMRFRLLLDDANCHHRRAETAAAKTQQALRAQVDTLQNQCVQLHDKIEGLQTELEQAHAHALTSLEHPLDAVLAQRQDRAAQKATLKLAIEEKQSAELRARAAEEEARQMRLKLQKIEKKAAEQSKDAVHGVANAKRRSTTVSCLSPTGRPRGQTVVLGRSRRQISQNASTPPSPAPGPPSPGPVTTTSTNITARGSRNLPQITPRAAAQAEPAEASKLERNKISLPKLSIPNAGEDKSKSLEAKENVVDLNSTAKRQWKMLQSRFSPEPDENEEDEDMRKSASERNWDSLMANMKLPSLDGSQVMNLKQKVASMKIRKNTSYISPYAPEIIKLERELSKRKKQPGESSLMQSKVGGKGGGGGKSKLKKREPRISDTESERYWTPNDERAPPQLRGLTPRSFATIGTQTATHQVPNLFPDGTLPPELQEAGNQTTARSTAAVWTPKAAPLISPITTVGGAPPRQQLGRSLLDKPHPDWLRAPAEHSPSPTTKFLASHHMAELSHEWKQSLPALPPQKLMYPLRVHEHQQVVA
ncbi:hypothetical protein CYMTET_42314 [Cymbomonas tetramitiformis]|uniref:Uncharacterized protein n=1 Tax=Cymbomonas tetramitiformis TaxID=36881 RepID=A0AAE0F2Q9_9CHLO|nr:hypothetical protein CYMTET_42314 [Cymbomonas tetramitiformis]